MPYMAVMDDEICRNELEGNQKNSWRSSSPEAVVRKG